MAGYQRNSNWWRKNDTLATCVRTILNCVDGANVKKFVWERRNICVERAAMRLLVGNGPGVGIIPHAKDLVSRLKIGVSPTLQEDALTQGRKKSIMEYLQSPSSRSAENSHKLFGSTVHFRFGLPSIEKDDLFAVEYRQAEAMGWLQLEKNKKLMKMLCWDVTNGATLENSADNLVYISSDSSLLKEIISDMIAVTFRAVPVFLQINASTTHSRHFSGKADNILISAVFDWLMVSQSQQIFVHRRTDWGKVPSSFSQSAFMYGLPIVYSKVGGFWTYNGIRYLFKLGEPHRRFLF